MPLIFHKGKESQRPLWLFPPTPISEIRISVDIDEAEARYRREDVASKAEDYEEEQCQALPRLHGPFLLFRSTRHTVLPLG